MPIDLEPELLRRAALDVLGPHADERARAALEEAEIAIVRDVSSWEGSGGVVRAHVVVLGVAASTLATIHRAPAVFDALVHGVSAAIADQRTALARLEVRYGAGAGPRVAGYRDAAPPAAGDARGWREALVAYLRAMGEDGAARAAERARVTGSSLSLPADATRAERARVEEASPFFLPR